MFYLLTGDCTVRVQVPLGTLSLGLFWVCLGMDP